MKAYSQRSKELVFLLDRARQEREVQIEHQEQVFVLKKVSRPF